MARLYITVDSSVSLDELRRMYETEGIDCYTIHFDRRVRRPPTHEIEVQVDSPERERMLRSTLPRKYSFIRDFAQL